MKLQQLRYLQAIHDNGFSITAASEKLYTSQPGVSKQMKLLEDELNLKLFVRNGKTLSGLTPEGQQILKYATEILQKVDHIKNFSKDLHSGNIGSLSIGTTHTQAKYVLPDIINEFHKNFPEISLNIHQGTSEQLLELLEAEEIDFLLISNAQNHFKSIIKLPWYQWDRGILVPQDHPLTQLEKITVEDLAKHPILTYVSSANSLSSLHKTFDSKGLTPNIVVKARDADVIKAYVRKGMGVGILAPMAYSEKEDSDLVMLSSKDILPTCITWLGFHKDKYLRDYMYQFIQLLKPGFDKYKVGDLVDKNVDYLDMGLLEE